MCGSENIHKNINIQKRLNCALKYDNHSRLWKNLATRELVGLHNRKEFNGRHNLAGGGV